VIAKPVNIAVRTGLTIVWLVYFSKYLVSSALVSNLLLMIPSDSPNKVCSRFHRAVELIGSRWTGAIIQTLLQGKARYALIRGAIPDITDRMLSERLRSLEAEELVIRRVVPESPVRVEYELTEKGRSLQASLHEIGAWAERWLPLETEQSIKGNRKAAS
jgi:DNA-binding HxlR family transcriptional regulator